MSIIRGSPAIICTVVTTGLADDWSSGLQIASVVKTESDLFVCTRVSTDTH